MAGKYVAVWQKNENGSCFIQNETVPVFRVQSERMDREMVSQSVLQCGEKECAACGPTE